MNMNSSTIKKYVARGPVFILSTCAGSGTYSIGEALREYSDTPAAAHRILEDFLPPRAVAEDLRRYRFLCEKAPFLLNAVYTMPIFYWRKYMREKNSSKITTPRLAEYIDAMRPGTVIGASHRATFWLSALKKKTRRDFFLTAVVTDFAMTLAWKYLFWDAIDRLIIPFSASQLPWKIPHTVEIVEATLPARREFYALKEKPSSRDEVLITGGGWGLGNIIGVTRALSCHSALTLHVACGDNAKLYNMLIARYGIAHPRIRAYLPVPSLAPLMERCGSCITKPGLASILETVAAGRQLFLLPGLPRVEEHNASYALAHYHARRFSTQAFFDWHCGKTR